MAISINNTNSSSGVGFFGLLTIVFVIAKIFGFIDWSWWLIFSPILIGVSVIFIMLAVYIYLTWSK